MMIGGTELEDSQKQRLHISQTFRKYETLASGYHDEEMFLVGKLKKFILGPAKKTHFFAKCTEQWRSAIGARPPLKFFEMCYFLNLNLTT